MRRLTTRLLHWLDPLFALTLAGALVMVAVTAWPRPAAAADLAGNRSGRQQLRSQESGCFAGFIQAFGPNRRSWLPPFCQTAGHTIPAVELIFASFFRVLDVGGGFG
jgi:hypothetical protein